MRSTGTGEVTAVIWDFDGTLVDTREKNFNVTCSLVERVKKVPPATYGALRSLADYERALHGHSDWRDFYRIELEMSDDEVHRAGARWLEHQLADRTAAPPYDGIVEVLEALADVPQGIVSLNARDIILGFLSRLELDHHFEEVLGYEAVATGRQKPEPDALVMCIESLTELRPGRVLYIGDHESDARCAHAAAEHFRQSAIDVDVVAVGAFYSGEVDDSGWAARPHVRARDPRDILGTVGRPWPAPALP